MKTPLLESPVLRLLPKNENEIKVHGLSLGWNTKPKTRKGRDEAQNLPGQFTSRSQAGMQAPGLQTSKENGTDEWKDANRNKATEKTAVLIPQAMHT
eukprot:1157443-Pelagomonas_calceolata.AAC.5